MKIKAYGHIIVLALAASAYFFLGALMVEILSPWIEHLAQPLAIVAKQILIPYLLVIPVIYACIAKLDRQALTGKGHLSWKQVTKISIVTNGLSMFFFILLMGLLNSYLIHQGQDLGMQESNNLTPIYLQVLILLVLNPIFEEIFFRKILLERVIGFKHRTTRALVGGSLVCLAPFLCLL